MTWSPLMVYKVHLSTFNKGLMEIANPFRNWGSIFSKQINNAKKRSSKLRA
ncbi:hypothetical protein SCRG_04762 [Saccharomyces cerevisiae RM11-1a]|uniref:Uncharacterized protein n=1 Tax=Saccharomyces cerevisiae (strain RM11-1a) TaxID=285006 RepID=B3LSH1_YEAS1|nr:hypothetical protein SCRG_04762 [Saccharomyces cerevisiae RM11-1a]